MKKDKKNLLGVNNVDNNFKFVNFTGRVKQKLKMQNNSKQPEVHVDENMFNHVVIKRELYYIQKVTGNIKYPKWMTMA